MTMIPFIDHRYNIEYIIILGIKNLFFDWSGANGFLKTRAVRQIATQYCWYDGSRYSDINLVVSPMDIIP